MLKSAGLDITKFWSKFITGGENDYACLARGGSRCGSRFIHRIPGGVLPSIEFVRYVHGNPAWNSRRIPRHPRPAYRLEPRQRHNEQYRFERIRSYDGLPHRT